MGEVEVCHEYRRGPDKPHKKSEGFRERIDHHFDSVKVKRKHFT